MKKELFAGVLLLVLIGLCAWNLRYLSRMCTQLDEAVAQAEASCAAGDSRSMYMDRIYIMDIVCGWEKTEGRKQ